MSEKKSIPRSKIIGMKVYDPDAEYVGDVVDLGLVPGEATFTLIIRAKTGATIEVSWENVSKIGDIILLKEKVEIPSAPAAPAAPAVTPTAPTAAPQEKKGFGLFGKKKEAPICPTCGKPATWIEQYKRWYCYNCSKYL